MKQYPDYKDSGIEWIGKIPAHWTLTRLGFHSVMIVPMRDKPTELEGEIPWLRIEDFDGKYVSHSKSKQGVNLETAIAMNLKIYPVGTVLCSCSCNMGKTAIVQNPLITNQTFIGIVPDELFSSDYLYYLIQSASQYLNTIATGAIQSYLSRSDFEKLVIPFPEKNEQIKIASIIDKQIRQIDSLIHKKNELIELLKEERTAVINQAVTKGLDPNVPMKDTGIEWLGEIPEHWGITPLKFLLKPHKGAIKTGPFGSQLKSTDIVSDGIKVYNQRTVYDDDFDFGDAFITEEKFQQLKDFEVYPHDILITSRGTIGKATIVPKVIEKGVLHPCLIRIQISDQAVLDRYLLWYINHSSFFLEAVTYFSDATTIEVIYSDTLKNIDIPLPPIKEQDEIQQYLEKKISQVNIQICNIEKEINLINEYKTSLINEAVTGKIDLRDYQLNNA